MKMHRHDKKGDEGDEHAPQESRNQEARSPPPGPAHGAPRGDPSPRKQGEEEKKKTERPDEERRENGKGGNERYPRVPPGSSKDEASGEIENPRDKDRHRNRRRQEGRPDQEQEHDPRGKREQRFNSPGHG